MPISTDSPDATEKLIWAESNSQNCSDKYHVKLPRGNDSVGSELWLEHQRNSVAQSCGIIEDLNFGASDMAQVSCAQPKLPSVNFKVINPREVC